MSQDDVGSSGSAWTAGPQLEATWGFTAQRYGAPFNGLHGMVALDVRNAKVLQPLYPEEIYISINIKVQNQS